MKKLTIACLAAAAVALIAYVTVAQPSGRFPTHPVVAALDTDNDGTVSAAELAKASDALKALDKNKDGQLTADEMRPAMGPGGMRPGRGRPGGPGGPGFTSPVLAKDDAEKKVLDVLEDMYKNERRGMMNVPMGDGRILRVLVESTGAKHVVEIGTSNGYSGIWMCLALRSTGGKLTTYEIDKGRAALARENFKRAGVDKFVTLVEGDAHKEVPKLKEPIDVLFLDADKEGYIDYLEKLLPLVKSGGLIIAHNMTRSQADPRYVKAITTNPALETVFIDMEASGVGLTMKKR